MGVISRIILRYIAGYLVLKGMVPQEVADLIASDPEFAALLGAGIVFVVEGAYALAKRFGWQT